MATKVEKKKALKKKIEAMKRLWKRKGQKETVSTDDESRKALFHDIAEISQCNKTLNS